MKYVPPRPEALTMRHICTSPGRIEMTGSIRSERHAVLRQLPPVKAGRRRDEVRAAAAGGIDDAPHLHLARAHRDDRIDQIGTARRPAPVAASESREAAR